MDKFCYSLGKDASMIADDTGFAVFAGGYKLLDFSVSTPCNVTLANGSVGPDNDRLLSFEGSRQFEGFTELMWTAESGLFDRKEYVLRVYDGYITYRVRLAGKAFLENVRLFGGLGGTKYFVSGFFDCSADYHTEQSAHYLVGQERSVQPYLFSPAPYVFPFFNEYNDRIVSVGIADKTGRNNYFRYTVMFEKPQKMWFDIPYYGREELDGVWESPEARIAFAGNVWDAVRDYCDWAAETFGYPASRQTDIPDWWKRPIFCGWNEQYNLRQQAVAEGRRSNTKDFSTQENYEKMMSRINSVGLDPGTIIIDDMWQTDYGTNEVDKEKWPDLRAFVDKRHSEGRRVLLWWRLWNCDGLPAEECIKSDGLSVTADPTSAAYRLRIKSIVHRLLSSDDGCMDCDGFKLDYIYRFPSFRDREATPHQKGIYGLELLRLYYKTIYDDVKKVKPDAMINTSFAHPYFADLYDVIRLHDYSSAQRSTMSMMRFRAKTVHTVFPDALIDTDGANSFTGCSQEVISHNLCACEVGIPSLYSLSNLSDSDLKEIRNAWDIYEKKNIRGK